ncbi:MAG: hypothetical protein K6A38_00980 [Lachnospiraceae bacterium]|nr:hypothetical protein [Lachnospiraceae bacterium]
MAIGTNMTNNNRINIDIERNSRVSRPDNDAKLSPAERLKEQNQKAEETKETQRREDVREAVYGDVIGVSENGDTATAKQESVKALEDGMVIKKNEENNEEDKEITTLTGYTEDQLQTLYSQGKIDKIKYDREIERRKELMQEDDEKAVQKTEEEENPEEGVRAVQKEEDKEEENEESSSRIKDEIAANEKAIETMGRVFANGANEELKAKAVEEALENGRMDIMDDIFNGSKNN